MLHQVRTLDPNARRAEPACETCMGKAVMFSRCTASLTHVRLCMLLDVDTLALAVSYLLLPGSPVGSPSPLLHTFLLLLPNALF